MKTMSREALYEDAWTRPLSRIAAEIGVSDTALRKMCDRHDIPTPGRGYWAQIESGTSFPRPQLRPAKDPRLETVRIVGAPQPRPEVKAVIDAAKAAATDAASAAKTSSSEVTAPHQADELQPLVRRTQAKLEAATVKGTDLVQTSGKGLFTVTASPVVAQRLGRLLSQLVRADESRGWTTEDGETGLRLVPAGEPIGFEIVEQNLRKPHRITDAEQAALQKYETARERVARSGRWSRRRSGMRSERYAARAPG